MSYTIHILYYNSRHPRVRCVLETNQSLPSIFRILVRELGTLEENGKLDCVPEINLEAPQSISELLMRDCLIENSGKVFTIRTPFDQTMIIQWANKYQTLDQVIELPAAEDRSIIRGHKLQGYFKNLLQSINGKTPDTLNNILMYYEGKRQFILDHETIGLLFHALIRILKKLPADLQVTPEQKERARSVKGSFEEFWTAIADRKKGYYEGNMANENLKNLEEAFTPLLK